MVLVGWKSAFFDCYVQSESIQMGLLKAIKYSTFEGVSLKEIVDGYEPEMNISGIDLTRFSTALIRRT